MTYRRTDHAMVTCCNKQNHFQQFGPNHSAFVKLVELRFHSRYLEILEFEEEFCDLVCSWDSFRITEFCNVSLRCELRYADHCQSVRCIAVQENVTL